MDFADIETGIFNALKEINPEKALAVKQNWGMETLWGISGSVTCSISQDEDHLKTFEELVAIFGEENRDKLFNILNEFAYDYDELTEGTQPW